MKRRLVVLLCVVAICGQAIGQIMSNPSQWYINNQMYSTRVFNSMVANSMLMRKGKGSKTPLSKIVSKASQFSGAPKSILPKLLASKAGGNSQAEAERFFEGHLSLYRDTARKDGFPANDLAYALEYFVVNNYHLYHDLIGSTAGVTIGQERIVYNQFKQLLSANPQVKKMTDRQKQEATEMLAILFGVNYSAYLARTKPGGEDLLKQSKQLAKDGLEKLLGTKIDQIKITNSGIELG